jgi:hypothetical protein
MKSKTSFLLNLIVAFGLALAVWPSGAQAVEPTQAPNPRQPAPDEPFVSAPVTPHVVNVDLRTLPSPAPWKPGDPVREVPRRTYPRPESQTPGPARPVRDPLLALQESASQARAARAFATPILNFEGTPYTGVRPPDTVGDVGPEHYVQMVNSGGGTHVAIFEKDGTPIVDFELISLWTAGGDCASGHGDPIVLYDQLADRWLFSEFANSGEYLCVYVSRTPDPVSGGWFLYDFPTPEFPDYPKYAVWPDAYYVSSNESSPAVYALDRDQMLAGGAATLQRFTATLLAGFPFQALIPSDLDGATPPPAGAPNYFMRHRDDEVHNAGANDPGEDYVEIWEFHVDWDTPANSTFTKTLDIAVTEFDSDLCGLESFECFPQPGSSVTLDPLREVVMWRLQYRNFGSYETLVGNLVTDVDGTDHGGVRWFELRKTGASPWTLHQEGTYAPDAAHRWLGSIAMDGSGNIALGYSVSDASSIYPSIRYTGRLASDPLGTMPQGEHNIIAGSGSQPWKRWGDYSAMSVDPVDDCTFWYTNEYIPESGYWQTRIATFKFPACQAIQGTLAGVVTDASTSDPVADATVQASGATTAHLDVTASGADGAYSMLLVSDTYTVTALAYGYQTTEIGGTPVVSGTTTTLDIALTPAARYTVSGTVTASDTGWPLYARLDLQGSPFDPPSTEIWTDPQSGHYSLTLAADITYTFDVQAWADGYDTASSVLAPLTAHFTQDFVLSPDLVSCNAPGYVLSAVLYADLEGVAFPPDGWASYDVDGAGQAWAQSASAYTGDASAVHSYGPQGHSEDGWLVTPVFTPTAGSDLGFWEMTEYASYYYKHSLWVCASGCDSPPTNYTEIAAFDNPPEGEWRQQTVDLSFYAGMSIQLAFRYEGVWADTWFVDHISVLPASCEQTPGGLVVGQVYDANTGAGLVGAEVAGGYDTALSSDSDDPHVGAGFYTLFSPSGTHTFSATMACYTGAVATATVPLSGTARQDFVLAAPLMHVVPPSLGSVQATDAQITRSLTITNDGAADLDWELLNRVSHDAVSDGGFEAGSPNPYWDEGGALGSPVCGPTCGDLAYAGAGFLRFGGQGATNTSAVTQTVTISEGTAALSFWLWIDADPATDQGTLDFLLNGNPVASLSEDDAPAYSDYAQVEVDVSTYADGGTHELEIVGVEIGDTVINFFVDEVALVVTSEAAPWLSLSPDNGTLAPGSSATVDVLFDSRGMALGEYTVLLGVEHNTPYYVASIPVTLTVVPGATWEKRVYVNHEPLGDIGAPIPVLPGDTIEVVDRVDVADEELVSFTLVEAWDESLELVDYALPSGSLSLLLPGTEIITSANVLTWTVSDLPGEWSYVLTKTFQVQDGAWDVDLITESLQVQDSAQRFQDVVLRFTHCVPVSDVTLGLVTMGTLYVDDTVSFSADIAPDDAIKPYSYTVDYGDMTMLFPASSGDDPLALDHIYDTPGVYDVTLRVWNCTMTAGQAVSDTLQVDVRFGLDIYLPLVAKNYDG